MPYYIKAEINGIQDFIFNIQSKGAAKALKARSFLVEAACELIRENLLEAFQGSEEFYTGGGNVMIQLNDTTFNPIAFHQLTGEIIQQLLPYQVTASFTLDKHDPKNDFGIFISDLNKKLNKEKLRFAANNLEVFQPGIKLYKTQTQLAALSRNYAGSTSFSFTAANELQNAVLSEKAISLCSKKLILNQETPRSLIPLPVWDEGLLPIYKNWFEKEAEADPDFQKPGIKDIISFEVLADFAKKRTGTDNIGVLKLDVDNLGLIFKSLKLKEDSAKLSSHVKNFFSKHIIELLNSPISSAANETFLKNIYTVYAGGDDCFFIGAWDAVIEFASQLNKRFENFEEQVIRKDLPVFTNPITLSAAILLVDSHFPVVRFAELAEQNLKKAKANRQIGKKDAAGRDRKGSIHFMGNTFTWEEFASLERVKQTLFKMVFVDYESKAFLQRIINSFENSNSFYWQMCTPPKPFNPAILWRFLYSFRDVVNKDYFRKGDYWNTFFSQTDGYYKKYVWQQFAPGKELSQLMPVAARWTELLTRNKTEQNMAKTNYYGSDKKPSYKTDYKSSLDNMAEQYIPSVSKMLLFETASIDDIKIGVETIEKMVKNNSKVTTHQIRNIFSLIQDLGKFDTASAKLKELQKLRPKLAYIGARQRENDGKIIIKVLDELIKTINMNEGDKNIENKIKGLHYIMESIVAYHKFYSKN